MVFIKKKILVSGYTSTLCLYLRKNLSNKFEFYNYKDNKKSKFSFFIHFAIINKINPNKFQIKEERKILRKCINICKKKKINKFILMSTFGAKNLKNNYEIMKYKLENQLKKANLNFLIIRPTKIINKNFFKFFFYLNKINFFLTTYQLKNPIFFESFKKFLCEILIKNKFNNKTYSIFSNFNFTVGNLKKFKSIKHLLKIYKFKIDIS